MMNKNNISRRKVLLAGATTVAAGVVASKSAFANYDKADLGLFGSINRVKDPSNMTGSEMKHAPVITAPAKAKASETVAVKVSVGAKQHPMTDEHWIERVRIFTATGTPLADVTLARTGVAPVVNVMVNVEETTTLVAQATCNLHGIWEARHTITV